MKTSVNKQRGVSFSGFLLVAVVLVFLAIGAMKIGPVYSQNAVIKNILNEIVHDSQVAGVREARESFTKRASTSDIKVITANDLVVSENGSKIEVTYFVKVPLVYNVSLYFDFNIVCTRNRVI